MLSIIVPVLNEEKIIKDSLKMLSSSIDAFKTSTDIFEIEVIISDAGSEDFSIEIVKDFCKERKDFRLCEGQILQPSIGKTVKQGIDESLFSYVLILPVDCRVSSANFTMLKKFIDSKKSYGGFSKYYFNKSLLMKIYAILQNLVRTKFLSHYVWTNGIVLQKMVLNKVPIPTDGFMEDVVFSDRLKQEFKHTYMNCPILVDSRLYDQKGPFSRMIINLIIMIFFRLGCKNKHFLKAIYKL